MQITTEEIFEEFEDLDPRDQSQYLLELGYDLPDFKPEEKRDCDLVSGCQSQVWLRAHAADDSGDPKMEIVADSDAQIVRGLITILIAAYSGRRASEVLSYPITDVFDRLNLRQYISPQRRNGLQGMVDRILSLAAELRGSEAAPPSDSAASASPKTDKPNSTVENVATSANGTGRGSAAFDAVAVRAQFPVLMQTLEDGLRPVFLDSGASAQKPQVVIDKEREVEEQYFANAYRGRYRFGARIDEELEASRATIAEFINAKSPTQIAFTPGTTAALNMVAFGWGRRHISAGDDIVITMMEHHANFVPWQQLAKELGANLKFAPLTDDGRIDLERLDDVLTTRAKVIAVSGTSNVLGTNNPVQELARRAHAVGAVIVVDGAQSVPHLPTDVQDLDVDFLVFSGHKLYGPTGVGVLYGKAERLDETDPILFGGHMIDQVGAEESTFAPPPARFEAGTLPIVQAIALGTAVKWMADLGVDAIHEHEQRLLKIATDRLLEIPGLNIYGPDIEHKGAIISFRVDGLHPEDLAIILDRHAVLTRHGNHCTMPLHKALDVSATTRASFAAYNTEDDIDVLVTAIKEAKETVKSS